jgi:hypothetical protein
MKKSQQVVKSPDSSTDINFFQIANRYYQCFTELLEFFRSFNFKKSKRKKNCLKYLFILWKSGERVWTGG